MILVADLRRLRVPATGAFWLPFALACLLALAACGEDVRVSRFSGNSMGTSWNITVVEAPAALHDEAIEAGVSAAIEEVNSLMSNWREDSEVSRFNALAVGEAMTVSDETLEVLAASLDIYRRSEGMFDVTVGPLVELWGFGTSASMLDAMPDEEALMAARREVGSAELDLDTDARTLSKRAPRAINLSAIAKGYGVDRAAAWLLEQGVTRFMVEIGGEVRTAGLSPRGDVWRIGIEAPELLRGNAITAIALGDRAIATSGDYRNYYEIDGQRVSHTIDPVTGRPITHNLASVSVVHDNCMYADGWATAIDVLGPERGLAVAEREGLAVYLLLRHPDGSFEARSSSAFAPYLN